MKIIFLFLINLFALNADDFKDIKLILIDNPYVLKHYRNDKVVIAYCQKENIDYFQHDNIVDFFKKAREFDSVPVAIYCTFPCVITGKIKLDSKTYDFELNEGGYAILKNKDEVRYFGDESRLYECGI